MYCAHFGLKRNPFLLTASADALYYASSHAEAMAQVLYGVSRKNGITLVLGEPGTGKTTLVRSLLDLLLPTNVVPVVILAPIMETPRDVLQQLLIGFNVRADQRPAMELFGTLRIILDSLASQKRVPFLVVDEAQCLTAELLDCLRLITTVQSRGQQSLQLLLVAQPDLGKVIANERMTALRQRIFTRCRLGPLKLEEVWKYLAFRIARAGGDDRAIFRPDAVDALATYSAGIPRVINLLADHSLLAAYSENARCVDGDMVSHVSRNLELVTNESTGMSELPRGRAGEFSDESWRQAINEFRVPMLPEPLRRFANSLVPPQNPTMSVCT